MNGLVDGTEAGGVDRLAGSFPVVFGLEDRYRLAENPVVPVGLQVAHAGDEDVFGRVAYYRSSGVAASIAFR